MTRLSRFLAGGCVSLLFAASCSSPASPTPTPSPSTTPPPAASTCTFVVPDTQRVRAIGADGGETFVEVEAPAGCAWTANVESSFVSTVDGASTGMGSGQARFRATPNTGAERSATASVAGVTVTVTQAPPLPADCRLSLFPSTLPVTSNGGDASALLEVADDRDCPWSLTIDSAFVEITSAQVGRGPATISLQIDKNSGEERRATLRAGDQSMTIVQAGAPEPTTCAYIVTPQSFDVSSGGKTITVQVDSPTASCKWEASSQSSFITISGPASGSAGDSVQFVVAANSGAARTGHVTVAGKTIPVRQSGTDSATPDDCYTVADTDVTLDPYLPSLSVSAEAKRDTCSWTAESHADFIATQGARSGRGSARAMFYVESNRSSSAREGFVSVAGHRVRVRQLGWPDREPVPPRSSESGSFLKFEGEFYKPVHLSAPPARATYRGHPDHEELVLWFDQQHSVSFKARSGRQVTPGRYLRAPLYPFGPASQDGFSLSGPTLACNTGDADFEIHEAKYGIGSVLERFRATFVRYCDEAPFAVSGEVSFIGATPVSIPSPSSFSRSTLRYKDPDGDTHTFTDNDSPFSVLTDGEDGQLYVQQKIGSNIAWSFMLRTGTGQLNEGTYEVLGHTDIFHAKLDLGWVGLPCSIQSDGRFRIYDVERTASGLERFHAWFEMFCHPEVQPVRGEIYIER